jgi:hypothetical protein
MALSQREKMLLVIPVALGGLIAFYYYVHEPLFARRAAAMELSDKAQTELSKDQTRLAREGDLKARQQTVAAKEQAIDAWVPGKNSAALFIWYLSQAEARSGGHIKSIKVGEPKVVTVSPQQGQAGTPAQGAPAAPPAGQQGSTQGNPADAGPALAVLGLDLKVEARFAEHLLFNQALEDMPLFLSTESLSLARGADSPMDRVNKLLQEGNPSLAAAVLSASPDLQGSYHVNLYFKSGKAGPTTEPMQFSEQAGRMDPFAMAGVDEFIRFLIDHYNSQPGTNPAPGSGRNPQDGPGTRSGQLG